MLVRATRGGEVHELKRQGLDFGRDRRHRLRGQEGIKIINGSFGCSAKSSSLKDAVDHAQDKNVLLVVAAGNDGEDIDKSPVYPASYGDSNILAVAASTSTDTLASFSNFGATAVDVAAPGDNIYSTYLGGGYKFLSGTSMASPYAAGVAALLKPGVGRHLRQPALRRPSWWTRRPRLTARSPTTGA